MKKFLLIAALFAALALLVTGCPTGGGDKDEKKEGPGGINLAEIFPGTVLNGEKAVITIKGDTITAVRGTATDRFDADLLTAKETSFNASAYTGIKFDYQTTQQVNVGLQDSGDSSTMWLITDWGAFTPNDGWATVECVFSKDLKKGWGSSTAFDKSKWEKLWIGCDNPNPNMKFEIKNFTFIK